MNRKSTLLLVFLITCSVGSNAVNVANLTIKIPGLTTEVKYYAFAAGDEVEMNLTVLDGKELKEIEVFRYPEHSLFMDYKTDVSVHKFKISEMGIYGIRMYNSNVGRRVCKLNLSRTPIDESTRMFNTQVFWKTVYDTSFYTVQEKYMVSSEYRVQSVQEPQYFEINSGANSVLLGGKSRITLPISLPKGTVEWYYTFAASKDEDQIKATTSALKLVSGLSLLVEPTGIAQNAMNLLSVPDGAEVCDIYLLSFENARLFEQKAAYSYLVEGSRENIKAGVVKMTKAKSGTYYLGIKNPANTQRILVSVEVAAVVYEESWGVRDVEKFNVTTSQVPYFSD